MTVHLQIASGFVGSVIGKQGDVIKSIREQSRSRVIIGDSLPGAEERDVTLKGSPSGVEQAMNLIVSSIAQNRANQAFSGDHGGSDSDISIKLLVANDQCGAIIGKGGEIVKQLREQSGARISIGKKLDFIRSVVVSGGADSVREAFSVLIHLLHEHPSSARDPFLHGYRAPSSNFHGGSSSSSSYSYGHSSHGQPHHSSHGPSSSHGPGHGSSHHAPSPSPAFFSDGPTQTLTLSIPSRSIGAIIGKRGQTISEIRHMSGCRIDVAPQAEGSPFRAVTLVGSSHSVEIAQILIQKYTYQTPFQ